MFVAFDELLHLELLSRGDGGSECLLQANAKDQGSGIRCQRSGKSNARYLVKPQSIQKLKGRSLSEGLKIMLTMINLLCDTWVK